MSQCSRCARWIIGQDDFVDHGEVLCGECYRDPLNRPIPESVCAQRRAAIDAAAAKIMGAFADDKPAPSIADNLDTVARLLREIDVELAAIRRLVHQPLVRLGPGGDFVNDYAPRTRSGVPIGGGR